MSKRDDTKSLDTESGQAAPVVSLARVKDRLLRQRQDAQATELATQFHRAMGWKGKPDQPGGKKSKRKKKRS